MTRKIAIVGAGYMAQEHAKAFRATAGARIVGIVGRSSERAQGLAKACDAPVFDSIASLYENTRADVVVVTVNELSMQKVATECFRFPWLCFLEKPVGTDLAEAEAITAEAKRLGVTPYVALNRRSYASTRAALAELAADDSPRLISVLDQQDMTVARSLGQPERVVLNWMYANSIHLVDYFHIFGRGDIVEVVPTVPWTPEAPAHVVATLRFSSGDAGVYQAVWNGPGPWSTTVTNRKVRLEMRPLEKLGVQRAGERRLTEVPADRIDEEFKPGLKFQAEQIMRALDGATPALATLNEATRSMRLCAAIYGLEQRIARG